jgi:trehalose monomycolate/heme transporter
MFAWWGRAMVRARWLVLVGGLLVALVGGLWGTGVFGVMAGVGFDDPASESYRTSQRLTAELGARPTDVIVVWSSATATVDDPAFRQAVTGALAKVDGRAEVADVFSYYGTGSPAFVSTDRHATYAVLTLTETRSAELFAAVEPDLAAAGLTTEVTGPAAVTAGVSEQVSKDIARAETFSMPILLILLFLVFGSLVAAGTPLLVGGLAILGAFTATRILAMFTDVSVFALNVITLIGLGMAIDYALFVVSRFREELRAGRSTHDAVVRTVDTAGRTVVVSGLTVALALAGLLLFPQMFLRSMGFGGMAAVLVAMIASITVLPALLAVLGPRVNAVRIPWRRGKRTAGTEGHRWARLAHAVMHRPGLVLAGTVALLVFLAVPFIRAEFGVADERVLPAGAEPRAAAARLATEFPQVDSSPVRVLVSGTDGSAAAAFAQRITEVDGVTSASVAATRGTSSVITVGFAGPPAGDTARAVVADIRALPAPPGADVLVGGTTAELIDLLNSLGDRLPWMALFVALSTFVLLFLAFGSIVLPLKAIVMNVVSIGASFGAVVWAFQDGHLAGLLGFTSTGDLEATQLILMVALLFGLSTDYEVFLLSRVREEWDRTGDNTAAVARGLQRTGGIITAAALLLIVVIGGFASGEILFIKMIGFGMVVALIVDATIVRALLVPATMRLLGRANWWLPGPLARVYGRFGIREEVAEQAPPVEKREPALV